jgi:hypothetical protein
MSKSSPEQSASRGSTAPGPGTRFGPRRLAQYLPGWLSRLPNLQVEGVSPAPLQPAVLVRQYTGEGVLAEPPLSPPVPTSKGS